MGYRALALLLVVAAVSAGVRFAGGLAGREIDGASLFAAMLAALCAGGLWLGAAWARTLTLLVALANAGAATLAALAGPSVVGVVWLAVNVAVLVYVSRTPLEPRRKRASNRTKEGAA